MHSIKSFKANFDDKLFAKLLRKTGPDASNINNYITKAVKAMVQNEQGFEDCQFSGKVIHGTDLFTLGDGWFTIGGITYRYHILDDLKPNKKINYKVVGSKGNVIYLKPYTHGVLYF